MFTKFGNFFSKYARFVRSSIISILIVCLMVPVLSACAAAPGPAVTPYMMQVPGVPADMAVWAMSARTTVFGISRVLAQAPGTGMYLKDNALVMVWGFQKGYGFYILDLAKMTAVEGATEMTKLFGTASFVNGTTGQDFVKWIESMGFAKTDCNTVAQKIGEVTMAGAGAKAADVASNVATTLAKVASSESAFFFVVIPAGMDLDTNGVYNTINPAIQQ